MRTNVENANSRTHYLEPNTTSSHLDGHFDHVRSHQFSHRVTLSAKQRRPFFHWASIFSSIIHSPPNWFHTSKYHVRADDVQAAAVGVLRFVCLTKERHPSFPRDFVILIAAGACFEVSQAFPQELVIPILIGTPVAKIKAIWVCTWWQRVHTVQNGVAVRVLR